MMNRNMAIEVREAREAGVRALNSLRMALRHLRSASNWGIVDILGGGMVTNLIKHSKISDARDCIQRAEADLDTFRCELADIRLQDVDIGRYLMFADCFFGDIAADIMVQSRIRGAIIRLEDACQQVEDVLYRLGSL